MQLLPLVLAVVCALSGAAHADTSIVSPNEVADSEQAANRVRELIRRRATIFRIENDWTGRVCNAWRFQRAVRADRFDGQMSWIEHDRDGAVREWVERLQLTRNLRHWPQGSAITLVPQPPRCISHPANGSCGGYGLGGAPTYMLIRATPAYLQLGEQQRWYFNQRDCEAARESEPPPHGD
jgi:hypothetical protein